MIKFKLPQSKALNTFAAPFVALLLSLVISGIIIASVNVNPVYAYGLIFHGAFGSMKNFSNTLANSIPLIFTGLSVAVASKAGILNLGVEGQLYMGGICGTLCGLYLPVTNRLVLIGAIILCSLLGGMIWGAIPGLLKAKLNTNEVIVAIMLNYVATLFTTYLIVGPLREKGSTVNQTATLPEAAQLTKLFPRTQLTTAFIMALLCVVLVWFVFKHTKLGFNLSAVGDNPDAARAGGINPLSMIILAMVASGAIASMAGTTEIIGKYFRFRENFSPGFGFTGLAVAVLAGNDPFGVVITAIFFGALGTGVLYMSRLTGISGNMSDVIQSIIILLVAAPKIIELFFVRRRKTL